MYITCFHVTKNHAQGGQCNDEQERRQQIAQEYTALDVNTSKVLFTTPQVCPPGLHGLMQEKDYIVADFKYLQAVPDPAVENRIISLLVVYPQKFLVLLFCPTVKQQELINQQLIFCSTGVLSTSLQFDQNYILALKMSIYFICTYAI